MNESDPIPPHDDATLPGVPRDPQRIPSRRTGSAPDLGSSKRQSLVLLASSRALRSVAAGFLNVAFPFLILTHLHENVLILGLIYAGGALSTAGLALVLGRLGSRWDVRRSYLLSLALLPVACLLLSRAPDLALAAVASALGGFSATGSLSGGGVGGVAQPLQTAVLSDLTLPRERTRMLSRFGFLSGVAAALGALIVVAVPFDLLFPLGFALSIAAVVLVLPVEVRVHAESRKPTARSKAVIRKFSLTGILNGVSQGLLTPFLIPFFVIVYGITAGQMAIYATGSGLIATFALLLSPWLEARWGFVPSLAYTRAAGAILAILMPFVLLFPVSAAIYLTLPGLRVMAVPTQTSAMMGMVEPADRAEVAGSNQAARVGAGSGATALSGFSLESLPLAVPFVGYAAAVFANIYLYIRLFGWSRRASESGDGTRTPAPDR